MGRRADLAMLVSAGPGLASASKRAHRLGPSRLDNIQGDLAAQGWDVGHVDRAHPPFADRLSAVGADDRARAFRAGACVAVGVGGRGLEEVATRGLAAAWFYARRSEIGEASARYAAGPGPIGLEGGENISSRARCARLCTAPVALIHP